MSSSALAAGSSLAGGSGSTAANFADFWKDDFAPLQFAGRAVLHSLREEEAADDADLYRRLSSSGVGSHLYFPSSSSTAAGAAAAPSGTGVAPSSHTMANNNNNGDTVAVTSTVQHLRSVPLPPLLAQELRGVKSHSFMGLLAPASLAWMSVDDKVFLWPFREPGSFISFKVPSGQSVIAVGLIRPKKGVFNFTVNWCLVITTPDEVILCALQTVTNGVNVNVSTSGVGGLNNMAAQQQQPPPDGSGLRLVPTSFRLATDNVRMLSVCGTETGRIFLGGDDGCLYEMTYQGLKDHQPSSSVSVEERLNQFYEEGEDVPAVLTIDNNGNVTQDTFTLGKRTWTVLSSGNDGDRPRKCRKLNRTSHASSWVSAVLPDFVLKAGSFIFGAKTATGGGRIERMEIDEDRKCLYTLSSEGWICSFDLRPISEGTDSVRLSAVMQTPRTARLYLEAVSRGQMLAPSTHGATLGYINFPGGGSAAKAGVGGMEGARTILKAADLGAKTNSRSRNGGGEDILKPISIHVVPPTESQRLTLMAVTAGGLRLYLSSLATNVLNGGANYSSGRQLNPLAPSSRLTLCHVRAPPPADLCRQQNLTFSVDAGVLGGIKPQIVMGSVAEKVPRVDATFYKQGVFVAAVEKRAKKSGIVTQQLPPGDVIVTACPDSVARKIEAIEDQNKQTLTVPGGITETTSMPMLSAYGTNAGGNEAVLPGGLVWDMAPIGDEETDVMRLAWNSQTPTDTELGIGLPPAYYPPSKIRARDITRTPITNGGPTMPRNNTKAVAIQNASLTSTALKVLGNVLTNAFLPRPIRQGITFQPPSLQSDFFHGARLSREYRISTRNGSSGFSTTAGESSRYSGRNHVPRSKVSRASRSARLRPWLLRPAAVPLNQFSTQHLTKPKQVVALNAGGLHYFCIDSVLSNLADALMSAGDNVSTDLSVSTFFASYGYKEGCAMCLALAIGCGPAAGNANYSEEIRSRASTAAFARAYSPRLVILSDQNGQDNKPVTSASDTLIPSGYGFFPSEICKGLNTLISRLLRSIWYKPAVVVTEGRMIKQQWSSKTRSTPAKVEVLLSESTLEDIRSPLRNLLSLMKNMFSPAVKTVPGVPENQGSMMDIETENGESQYLTRALQYRSQLRAGDGVAANQLSPAEQDNIARLIEEKNIHSLYRLISRVVQLLNLISLLQQAQSMSELREVDWGLLHGLTISQLVQTPEGQERLESLLNALVTTSASDGVATPSALADQLANKFADQCYLYFSPGSRSAYIGIKDAKEALSCPIGSSQRASLGNMAANHLRVAAKHWFSAPLVTGRILHPKDQESFEQISFRAIQYGSPLAKAVDALMKLEDVVSVVDVCLLTAANFSENVSLVNASADGLQSNASGYDLPWEQHLYHKRRDPESSETTTATGRASSSPSSPTHVVAYGTTVTSKDAVDTCYALIFHYLSILLRTNPQVADRMIMACADDTNEDSFLDAFFRFLLESDRADTLLRINSSKLDKWLRGRNNPDLLWRYCNVQGKLFEAAEVSWDRANDSSLKLPLSERIDCLTRALNAYEREQPSSYAFHSADEIQKKIEQVRDILQFAKIQNRILHFAHHSLKPELKRDLTAERLERLETSLVPVSELYNDYAAAFSMFEHCLSILKACHCDQVDDIENLWKNIVCEEILPCATRSEAVHSFLQLFVVDVGPDFGGLITFLDEQTPTNSQRLFESGEWSKQLETRVVRLGKELYFSGNEFVFPIDFLLGIFEELRECAGRSIQANWSLFVLARVGVPFIVILDAYESFIQRDESNFMAMGANQHQQGDQLRHKRREQLSNIIDLIDYWVNSARNRALGGDGMNETARTELSRAVASGWLMPKLDGIRSKLETMPNSSGLIKRVRAIEEAIQYM